LGWCHNRALVISDAKDESLNRISRGPVALICQTTFPQWRFRDIADELETRFFPIEIHHTICPFIKKRQQAVSQLAHLVDAFWVIGSAGSANTLSLLEIARQYFLPSMLIQDPSEINSGHLENISFLGITAGASTPQQSIQAVLNRIKDINKDAVLQAAEKEAFL